MGYRYNDKDKTKTGWSRAHYMGYTVALPAQTITLKKRKLLTVPSNHK